jgi:hypothetical protein
MLRLLQENIGKTLEDTGIGNCFLNRTLIAQEIVQGLTSETGSITKLLHIKGNNYQNGETTTVWEKVITIYSTDKGSVE